MKTKIYLMLLICSGSFLTQAQSIEKNVISAAGKTLTAGNIQLDFTAGEPFAKTLTAASNSITQGFHQPSLTLARLVDATDTTSILPSERLNENLISGIGLTVYPNPAVDFINLKLNTAMEESLFITVANIQGQIVVQQIMNQELIQIDFSKLVTGTYIVIVKNSKGDLSNSYRVIKTN